MVSRYSQFSRLASLLLVAFAFVLIPYAQGQLPNHLTKRVVADYGSWSKTQVPPYSAAQIPYRELTHINHAGINFDANGNLQVPDGFIEPELLNQSHALGVKVLLLLGGDFGGMEANGAPAARALVENILAFEKQYGYDGVDLDWEYPSTSTDKELLTAIMAGLRSAEPSYVLSVDVPPWNAGGYDTKRLQSVINYVNIMMYDCAGQWTAHGQLNSPIFWDPRDPAPYECQPGGSASEAASIYLQQLPPSQINMGTPFYGYVYTNINQLFGLCPNSAWTPDGDCDNTVLTGNYGPNFKPVINKQGWHTIYDPIALVPYMLRDDGGPGYITYDDYFSTYNRVWYSDWVRGLGGTFMWSLDADYDGHSQDLMDAMYAASAINVRP